MVQAGEAAASVLDHGMEVGELAQVAVLDEVLGATVDVSSARTFSILPGCLISIAIARSTKIRFEVLVLRNISYT